MRKSGLGICVLVLSTISAVAADLPVKPIVAPEILPTWAGWYVGLNAGGVSAGVSPSAAVSNNNIFAADGSINQVQDAGSSSFRHSGVLEGGQVGYLGQWGNVVAGIEAGIDWMGINTTKAERTPYINQNCNGAPLTDGCFFSTNRSINSDWMFTLLGRAGLAYGPVLPYITGGLAVSNLRYRYTFANANGVGSPTGFVTGGTQLGSTEVGFAVGGGLDWQVAPRWSVRAEYLYVQFDALSGTTPTFGLPPNLTTTTTMSISSGPIRENIGRIAVSYRFGGGESSPLAAMAADLPVKAAPPAPPAPVASWTGLYAGADAGAGWSRSGDWTFFDPNPSPPLPPPLIIAPPLGARTSGVAAIAGFHAGANWQFAPTWVLGIEGDYSWSNLADNRSASPLSFAGVPSPRVIQSTFLSMKSETRGLASVRGRLGYVGWANTLFYATGGVAWEQEHFTGVENNLPPTFATNFLAVANTSKTTTGWVAGAGAEMMVANHFSVRAEYLYYGFNSGTTTTQANLVPNPGAFPLPFMFNFTNNQNIQTVRVGFSYKI